MESGHCVRNLVTLVVVLLSAVTLAVPKLVCATNAAGAPCHFPAIFNFGDSNSDTGGLSAAFGQAGPPSGETYFHAPAGRYSDGRLVIDFIGTYVHMPPGPFILSPLYTRTFTNYHSDLISLLTFVNTYVVITFASNNNYMKIITII